MSVLTRIPDLDEESLERFGQEVNAIQQEIKATLGDRNRRYIKRMIAIQRGLALAGRLTIYASLPLLPTGLPFVAVLGAGAFTLGVAKILENMEIGHNVIHGQWDWMNDPAIHSASWEWDNVSPADQWKHSHNVVHHTWTNVIGKDRDVGYDILRISEKQPWKPAYLLQPFYATLLALLFEWGVGVHDIDLTALRSGKTKLADVRPLAEGIARKAGKQMMKDYVLWPLLAGPFFFYVLGANAVANVIRNVWSFMIIFCGHFPDGTQLFTEEDVAGETRGGWYLRQILGSCNIEGGPLFHVMSGNLSHQIEHHLFPDMPSNRYPEAAPRVRALCARYGIPYNSGSLARQFGTTVRAIVRLAWPGGDGRAGERMTSTALAMTTYDDPPPSAASGLTIDELAAATRLPSRTIRFYQSKGALMPPEIRGRVAYYGQGHVERLKLIAQLQDRGLRIDAIGDLLKRIDRGELDLAEWLGVEEQMQTPWANDRPRTVSEAELYELAGTKRPGLLADLQRAKIVERRGDVYLVASPALLSTAVKLEAVGIDLDMAAEASKTLRKHLGRAVADLVELFVSRVKAGQVDVTESGPLFETLRGAGTEAVRVLFARAMEKALRELAASGKVASLSAEGKRKSKSRRSR